MKKKCVKYLCIDGLEFIPGLEYEYDFNPVDQNLYIYTVWGYTTISPLALNTHFI